MSFRRGTNTFPCDRIRGRPGSGFDSTTPLHRSFRTDVNTIPFFVRPEAGSAPNPLRSALQDESSPSNLTVNLVAAYDHPVAASLPELGGPTDGPQDQLRAQPPRPPVRPPRGCLVFRDENVERSPASFVRCSKSPENITSLPTQQGPPQPLPCPAFSATVPPIESIRSPPTPPATSH